MTPVEIESTVFPKGVPHRAEAVIVTEGYVPKGLLPDDLFVFAGDKQTEIEWKNPVNKPIIFTVFGGNTRVELLAAENTRGAIGIVNLREDGASLEVEGHAAEGVSFLTKITHRKS